MGLGILSLYTLAVYSLCILSVYILCILRSDHLANIRFPCNTLLHSHLGIQAKAILYSLCILSLYTLSVYSLCILSGYILCILRSDHLANIRLPRNTLLHSHLGI